MAGQVEDERERRQDGGAERTPGADPGPPGSNGAGSRSLTPGFERRLVALPDPPDSNGA